MTRKVLTGSKPPSLLPLPAAPLFGEFSEACGLWRSMLLATPLSAAVAAAAAAVVAAAAAASRWLRGWCWSGCEAKSAAFATASI
jgi:hypothetical protein